ncbi:DUF58 domain-containing protein [Myxosarcina sp. GI1(2024)]
MNGVYISLDRLARLRYQARGFSFLPRQPINSLLAGRHASRLRGRGLNFEELRRYQPGDDIRTIDWKVTARTGKTHTRVYTEERDRPTLLIVDQRLSMFFGSQRAMKSVTAAEVAALTAWGVVDAGDRVGAIVFDDSDLVQIRPDRSRERVMRILKAIATKNQALKLDREIVANPAMLNQALTEAVRTVTHDHLICLVGDLNGADAETRRLMTRLSQHNDVIVAFIYDPLETALPQAGRLTLSDGERQLAIDSNNTSLRQRYQNQFQERLTRGKTILLKQDVPLLQISTSEDVTAQLRRLLGGSR